MPPHGTGSPGVHCTGGEIVEVHPVSAGHREGAGAPSSPGLGVGGLSNHVLHTVRGSVDRALYHPGVAVTTLVLSPGLSIFLRPRAKDDTTVTWTASRPYGVMPRWP
jgi:hypothetical protein